MKLPLAFVFGLLLGLFTVILLPAILLVWLDAWWRRHELDTLLDAARPTDCDPVDIAPEYPTEQPPLVDCPLPAVFEAWIRKQGLR